MAKTYNELLTMASIIRTATVEGENTAERVGEFLTECLNYVKENDDTLNSAVTTETDRATDAESTIRSNVSGLTTTVNEHTSTLEQVLAKDVELDNDIADIEEDLTAEQTRATNAEQTIRSNVSGLTNTVNEHTSTLEHVLAKNAEQDTAISANASAAAAAQSKADSAYSVAIDDTALRAVYPYSNGLTNACSYNSTTGYYEMNGLTDITKEEMRKIWAFSANRSPLPFIFSHIQIRTNYPFNIGQTFDNSGVATGLFAYNPYIEVVSLSTSASYGLRSDDFRMCFYNCTALTTIMGFVDLSYVTSSSCLNNMFYGCNSLQNVRIKKIKVSGLKMGSSASITAASISFLISNAANTGAISVTVHSDVLSAINHGEGDWAGIADAAATQLISFVS